MMYTACFTGHRMLDGQYEGKRWHYLLDHLKYNLIPDLFQKYKITKYISGMALGVDTIAAEAVLYNRKRFSLHLEAAVPFEDQPKIWPAFRKERYHTILKQCDNVNILYGKNYENWKLQKRNEYMVDESRYVIAVWDGYKKGGTYNCYSYAQKKHKEIIIVNPYTLDMDRTNYLIPM